MVIAAVIGVALQDAYNHGITISPDGRHVAIGTCSPAVRLYRLSDGKLIRTYKDTQDPYQSGLFVKPTFSSDGKYMTAGSLSADGGVNPVWAVSTGKVLARLTYQESQLTVCSFAARGHTIFGTFARYSGGDLHTFSSPTWKPKTVHIFDSKDTVGTFATSNNPDILVRISWDGGALQERSPDPKHKKQWENPKTNWPNDIYKMAFSADGKTLVGAGDGWCAIAKNNKAPLRTKTIPKFTTRSIGVSPTGTRVFLGSREGQIAQFNAKTGELSKLWRITTVPIYGLAVTKDGNRLLSYDGSHIEIWNLKTYTVIRKIRVEPTS